MIPQFVPPADSPVRLLRAVPPWRTAATAELMPLAAAALRRRFAPGERITRDGELQIIVEGQVRGQRGVLGPGDAIGLTELLAGRPAPTWRGFGAVELLAIARGPVVDALEESFPLWRLTARHYAERALAAPRVWRDELELPAYDGELGLAAKLVFLRRLPGTVRRLQALTELAQGARELHAAPGEILWEPGDLVDSAWVVVAGDILLDNGHRLGPRASAGFLEGFVGMRRRTHAVAASPLRALVLEHELLFDVLEDHPAAAMDVLTALAAG